MTYHTTTAEGAPVTYWSGKPDSKYRPHLQTSFSVRIKNALHSLNLNRNDIVSLPDGASVSRNITTDRTIAVLLEDLLSKIEDGDSK